MQSQVPEYILKVLRKQLNLEQDDTSHDEEILKLPAFEKLNKYVDWRLGKSVLTDFFVQWANDCGITIIDQYAEREELKSKFENYRTIILGNNNYSVTDLNRLLDICSEYKNPKTKITRLYQLLGYLDATVDNQHILSVA